MRDNLKSRISHIFRLHLSYCFFPFITNATFFFFFIKQHFASQLTDIYMQGSIQERFIKLRSRIIYRASKPLHSSEQIIAL
ncbi:hypothetical protein [Bacteroides finegoldii]|jgi:hypothetical protein|uniref:hypothetical protein n=1 Tax=Bacteroides finegoldii TaxID=338188 RepID=UPI000184365C|nr:hypothetical protein [Bacteroides finegoldii]EEX43838.1 hypothetical protein BACFIN_08486 [Bacteroides finegoldii DSM 17565]